MPLAAISGCSAHPIVDDVSPIPTEEIVKSARCEMKLGLVDELKAQLKAAKIADVDIDALLTPAKRHAAVSPAPPPALASFLEEYGKVGVAYDFEFDIKEHNHAEAGIGFKLPYTSPAALDLGASASLDKIRTGKRTFSSQETFGEMLARGEWCNKFRPREKNLLYPITGSIGLRKVMKTFIALSEQGGGKESFVDALSFTTTISGSITPTVKLNPVSSSFRLISATGNLSADRTDLHKVKISLAFPVAEKPKKTKGGVLLPVDPNEQGTAPYVYNPVWRARYNICVADARDREDAFKRLRDSPPEVYCIEYANAFVPRTTGDVLKRSSSGYYGYRRDYNRYDEEPGTPRTESPPPRTQRQRQQPRVWWW
ncbi:MAG: hypothetical protein HC868_05165 [Sphingomonadales bacterium]|nr:hypothetical protein [Sphingomonadales bacterium]